MYLICMCQQTRRADQSTPQLIHSYPPSFRIWCQACPRRNPSWPHHTSWFGKEPLRGLSLQARSTESNPPLVTWCRPSPQKTFLCQPGEDERTAVGLTYIRTVNQHVRNQKRTKSGGWIIRMRSLHCTWRKDVSMWGKSPRINSHCRLLQTNEAIESNTFGDRRWLLSPVQPFPERSQPFNSSLHFVFKAF